MFYCRFFDFIFKLLLTNSILFEIILMITVFIYFIFYTIYYYLLDIDI